MPSASPTPKAGAGAAPAKPPAPGSGPSTEAAALEALLRARERLHARRLGERADRAAALGREIAAKERESAALRARLAALADAVREQARLADAAAGDGGGGGNGGGRVEPHER